MSEERPIRIGGEKRLGQFLFPWLEVILDGEPVDRKNLVYADEQEGVVDRFAMDGPIIRFDHERKAPLLLRQTGTVEIRLKEPAMPGPREVYRALRRGEHAEARRLLDEWEPVRKERSAEGGSDG